jgi:ABC-type amino acid transport substrate-binding protein
LDSNNQLIEALKDNYVDVALIDYSQSKVFVSANDKLKYILIEESKNGYGAILNKNSDLTQEIDKVLKGFEENEKLESLKNKWFKDK